MIILEGPDNSGKTTLANKLIRAFNWPIEHSKRFEPGEWVGNDRDFMAYMHSVEQIMSKRMIRDRVYAIGENVYGPLLRGQSLLGVFANQSLMNLANTQTPIIYCRPPKSFITATKKKEMDGVIENHPRIIERYDNIMSALEDAGAFVYRYDWTADGAYESLLKHLVVHMNMFNLAEDKIHEFTRRP